MTRRAPFAISLLAVAGLALTGCAFGGGAPSTGSSSADEPAAEAPDKAPAEGSGADQGGQEPAPKGGDNRILIDGAPVDIPGGFTVACLTVNNTATVAGSDDAVSDSPTFLLTFEDGTPTSLAIAVGTSRVVMFGDGDRMQGEFANGQFSVTASGASGSSAEVTGKCDDAAGL